MSERTQPIDVTEFRATVEAAIEAAFGERAVAGVVGVDREDTSVTRRAFGRADRRHDIANTIHTRFSIASGTKGLTALTVMSLVVDGTLSLATTARSLLRYGMGSGCTRKEARSSWKVWTHVWRSDRSTTRRPRRHTRSCRTHPKAPGV